MIDILDRRRLLDEAVCLGILTARRVKPLSRLEYPPEPQVLDILAALGLVTAFVIRYAQNGAQVSHTILSHDPSLIRQYTLEFDRTVIEGETPAVVRVEAGYFGYPACCAEAYISRPYSPNGLSGRDRALLFHYACPGCRETPALLPLYRSAWNEARHILKYPDGWTSALTSTPPRDIMPPS